MFMPALNNSPRRFFDGACKNKSTRIRFVNKVFKFSKFKPVDYRKDDVAIFTHFKFSGKETPFAFVNGDASAEIINKLVFDDFTFSGNDCYAGICLYAFYHIVNTTCGRKVGEYRVQGSFNTKDIGSNAENNDINAKDYFCDGE